MSEYVRFTVKVAGAEIQQDIKDDVLEVLVDSNLHLPDMAIIQLYDDDLQWVDDTGKFDIGKSLEILYDRETLFKGEITSLEPEFSETGRATLTVRGYDKSHRLHRGRKTRTFLNKKDSVIVGDVASAAGLSVEADGTSATQDYVIQHNQTDMEFLLSRAQRVGYQLYTTQGKLVFKKSGTSQNGPTLEWGDNLRSFRPRWTGVHQAEKFAVYGWDNAKKQVLQGKASSISTWNQGSMSQSGGDMAKSGFKGAEAAEAVVTTHPVSNVDDATAMAEALGHDISSDFVQAEGLCFGDPKLLAGVNVKIDKVGTRFSGKYFVTAATHVYRDGRYETNFSVTGQQPNTLHALLGEGGTEGQGLIRGHVVGLVTNLNDDLNIGRFKVKYPSMGKTADGVEIESCWVRPATPMAGKERGFMYLPEVDDEVLIAFEHGDPHRPYMVGGLWSTVDKPPEKNAEIVKDGTVNQRIIHSRSGHRITLDDTQGQEKILIYDKSTKNYIEIDSKTNTLNISLEKDINVTAKGDMNFKANGDINMDCKNMTIKTMQNYTVNATSNIEQTATANATYKATAQATVEGTSMLTLKNAAAEIAMTGPQVDVNKGALTVI